VVARDSRPEPDARARAGADEPARAPNRAGRAAPANQPPEPAEATGSDQLEAAVLSSPMFQSVLDTIPQCVFWKNAESVFMGCNARFARDAGFDDPSKVVGLTDYDMTWKATADRYRADDLAVMESGVAKIDYEEQHPHRDGSGGWARTSKFPLRARDGKVIGVLCIFEDVTELKRAEAMDHGFSEAVLSSEAMFMLALDSIPQRVFWKDTRSVFVGCNVPFAHDAGFGDPSELVGLTDLDMPWQPTADLYRADDQEVMRTGIPKINFEEPQLRSDGRQGWLRTSKIPVRDADGLVTGLLGTYEDITDQKRAEEALRQSEERYRNITETITDYVFSVVVEDGKATVTTHGAGCLPVTGYTSEELAEHPYMWIEMVVPENRGFVTDQARRLLAGELVAPIEHCIVRKDGALRWVRNTLVPRFDPAGTLIAYDGLIQDITERRALQEQLLHAQKMEGIGRLAGGIAHDFNNLLTAILGYVEMARIDLPDDLPDDHPLRTDLDEIGGAGDRAASLTRQLLAFASKQIVATVRLDLSAVVADLLKMLRPLLGENIAVETVLEPDTGTIEADPGQIQQLLVNLTVNARDAMPNGGRLIIETATEDVTETYAASHPGAGAGSYVRLSVTDTGIGMTEEVRSHLFEPFFTTKPRGQGTGLGLATCHGIVRQMGGYIRVFSEPDCGATFRIFLPRVDGPATARATHQPASPTPTGTETVLVVEDESIVRRLAVLGLRSQGYTVIEACDGVEALKIAKRMGPQLDFVVSDVIMPGMSGPELLKRLAAVAPRAKRLLVSGHAEETVLPAGLIDVGAAFLPKPFTPERLARKVREVLDAPET
jgi:PAS domain S-box-containing protein